MSSFVKLVAVLSAGLVATTIAAEKTKDDKSRKPEAKGTAESGDKKSKKDKDKKKAPSADPNAAAKSIEVPMPNGRDAKGIKIPYFDNEGKLQMRFDIGVATRIDDNHIEMAQLQVETFNADGEHEMTMDLPTSVLDLTTSVITAQKKVTIKREDFELTGNTMIFNTKTKQGGLGGNVRMLIYNLENETAPTSPAAATPTTPEPQAK